MISKSLSRNTKSFESLYDYLSRDDYKAEAYNLYCDAYNKAEIIKEFMENAKYLNRARGKNYLYHEILSLPKNDLKLEKQEKILSDLASKYIALRAQNHLVYSVLHKDKEHTHIHLMISANEIMGEKRVRLSKKEFSDIQKELEEYKNSLYPELEHTSHYQKSKDYSKSRNKEQELRRRTKKATQKEFVTDELENLFASAKSKEELEQKAKLKGFEFYTRGKSVGVVFKAKKYRLKTLGVDKEYQACIDQSKNRENEFKEKSFKENSSNKSEKYRDNKAQESEKKQTQEQARFKENEARMRSSKSEQERER